MFIAIFFSPQIDLSYLRTRFLSYDKACNRHLNPTYYIKEKKNPLNVTEVWIEWEVQCEVENDQYYKIKTKGSTDSGERKM